MQPFTIRLLKVLLLVSSNSCQCQGGSILHSAHAVTAWACVVFNRQRKRSWSSGFFVWSCWFCLGFFWNAADGKLAGAGEWQPSPGREAGAVLGPEPAPCTRAIHPSCARVPCVTGEKNQCRGETKASTHSQLANLCNEERSAETSSGRKLTSFCGCTHKEQSKAQTGKALLKHEPSPHPCERLCATRWAA